MTGKYIWSALFIAAMIAIAGVSVPLAVRASPSGSTGGPDGTGAPGDWGGMMGGGMMGGGIGNMWALHEQDLAAAAQALGIRADELTLAFTNGQSVEQLAKAKNVKAEAVWDAITAARKAYFDGLVKDGVLTQSQAGQNLSFYSAMGPATLYGGAVMRSGGCHGPATSASTTST